MCFSTFRTKYIQHWRKEHFQIWIYKIWNIICCKNLRHAFAQSTGKSRTTNVYYWVGTQCMYLLQLWKQEEIRNNICLRRGTAISLGKSNVCCKYVNLRSLLGFHTRKTSESVDMNCTAEYCRYLRICCAWLKVWAATLAALVDQTSCGLQRTFYILWTFFEALHYRVYKYTYRQTDWLVSSLSKIRIYKYKNIKK